MQFQFNSQGITPNMAAAGGGELWSDDSWNQVVITKSDGADVDQNDKSKGGLLLLTLQAGPGGPDQGKTAIYRLDLWHADATFRDRAIGRMAAICFATGLFAYNDTNELIGRPFWIHNKHRHVKGANGKADATYNNFDDVKNMAGVSPGSGQQSPGPTLQQPMMPSPAPAAPSAGWNNAPAAVQVPQQAPFPPAGGFPQQQQPLQPQWNGAAPPQQQQFAPQAQPQPQPSQQWNPNGAGPGGAGGVKEQWRPNG